MTTLRTLTQYLLRVGAGASGPDLAQIMSAVSVSVKLTAASVSRGPLILDLDTGEVPTEMQLRSGLRRMAIKWLQSQTEGMEQLAGISVSGSSVIRQVSPTGRYLLLFDPMHGTGNLVDNLPVGSAFAIFKRDVDGPCTAEDFMQLGTNMIAAGLAIYGPRTTLILSTGDGVDGFTLDRDVGNFVLTHPKMVIPVGRPVFAINAAEAPYWPSPVKRYVEECILGVDGPRGRDFVMRWNASALLGSYRVMNSGGLFLLPDTGKGDAWLAPLLHNAIPLAFLAEQAGGRATTGYQRVLEVLPDSLTSAVPLFFGCSSEVNLIQSYFTEYDQKDDFVFEHPLFNNRTLFTD